MTHLPWKSVLVIGGKSVTDEYLTIEGCICVLGCVFVTTLTVCEDEVGCC